MKSGSMPGSIWLKDTRKRSLCGIENSNVGFKMMNTTSATDNQNAWSYVIPYNRKV